LTEVVRCPWGDAYPRYHDEEWGVPLHDDRRLFELLVLEGAQAGLSWATILAKREGYQQAFADFDAEQVAGFTPADVERLVADTSIVRHRGKIEAAITNAVGVLEIQRQHGSLDAYLWNFVGGAPQQNAWRTMDEVPVSTPMAMTLSQDLRARGFRFVGPTTMYAFMQAAGFVNDHLVSCFRWRELGGGS
jgi:DNA-3-methyladenine glycosylase I